MFSEAQNTAIVRTELDAVFFPEFNYEDANPVMTNCKNAMIFRQETTDKAFDIEEVYRGVNLFPIITETQTVPTSTPPAITGVDANTIMVGVSFDLTGGNLRVGFQAAQLTIVSGLVKLSLTGAITYANVAVGAC